MFRLKNRFNDCQERGVAGRTYAGKMSKQIINNNNIIDHLINIQHYFQIIKKISETSRDKRKIKWRKICRVVRVI